MRRLLLVAVVVAVAAGCGGEKTVTVTTVETVTRTVTQTTAQKTNVRVYFLRDGKVAPVGPGARGDRPRLAPRGARRRADGGRARDSASRPGPATARTAQIVYTLSQFDPAKPVDRGQPPPTSRTRRRRSWSSRRSRSRRLGAAARDRHGEHVRGDVRVRPARPGRQGALARLRHRHLGSGTRGTFDFTSPSRPRTASAARRLRALGRGRLEDERGRDPAHTRALRTGTAACGRIVTHLFPIQCQTLGWKRHEVRLGPFGPADGTM